MEPQAPTRGSDIARGGSMAVLVIDLVLLVGLALATIRLRPTFSKIFDDFETELPGMTRLLLSVPGWLILLGAVLGAAVIGLKELLIREARVNLMLNLAVLVGLLGLGAVAAVALMLPLTKLITPLS